MAQSQFRNWKPIGKGDIKLGNAIGEGAESKVYKASYKGNLCAAKEMWHGNEREIQILSRMKHENVIRYIFTERIETRIYIVLELCYCNLKQYVKKKHDHIHLPQIEVLRQIVEGVNYLHNGKQSYTVHRDLKPSNILFLHVERDDKWIVKISDFGLSKDLDPTKTSTQSNLRGSAGYIAPELLCKSDGSPGEGRIRKETDMFSLGVIFYYTLSGGSHPFSNDPCDVEKAVRDCSPNMDDLEDEYKFKAESLILSMLDKDRKKRVTICEVKLHFLFWKPGDTLSFLQEVSDLTVDKKKNGQLINKLEKGCRTVIGVNWVEKIKTPEYPGIKDALERRRPKCKTLLDLMRLIRNWKHHYNDETTTQQLRDDLGSFPDGLVQFITSKFPLLLPHVYEVMKEGKDNSTMKQFYEADDTKKTVQGSATSIAGPPFRPEPIEDSDGDLLLLDEEKAPVAGSDNIALQLRSYQLELAEQAIAGHNSMIVAPTGSGKTAVAVEIIRQHLQKDGSKSILFFVSKTTLARQQFNYFSRHLKKELEGKICYLIGENSSVSPVGMKMKENKLIVLTPRILIDELERMRPYIEFSDFSLMIFDECHHTTKKHPYKGVMDLFFDSGTETPIQVVAMTASPGVGKGRDRVRVLENLITLLANLNITQCPAVVVRHKQDLEMHQNEIKECHIKVEIEQDIFTKKILKAVELIEKRIESLDMAGSAGIPKPPSLKSEQMYEHWVVELKKYIKLRIHDTDPSNASAARILITYAEHLQMYYTLLYLKKHIPNAMKVTNSLASFDQMSEEGTFLRKINSELEKASLNSSVPMLERLFEEVRKQFINDANSKCIIFVPRKSIACALVECMTEDSTLSYLCPEYITGSSTNEQAGAMTKPEQENSVDAFRSGKCKVLIATSVAEEGLDIQECNLVIMYNYVTGEVGRIQREGRGRAKNSRSLLIVPHGSSQIKLEQDNRICAAATEYAIKDLNELTNSEREARIQKIQKAQAKERSVQRKKLKQRLEEASKWRILCGKCQAQLTTADKLRQIKGKHKFVTDENFLSRVTKKSFHEQNEITPGVYGVGRFCCKDEKCRNYLGLEMRCNDDLYPTLTVKQLIFENLTGERRVESKWNKCPFAIEDMVDEEVHNSGGTFEATDEAQLSDGGEHAENLTSDQISDVLNMTN